jgi:hypothetical protein
VQPCRKRRSEPGLGAWLPGGTSRPRDSGSRLRVRAPGKTAPYVRVTKRRWHLAGPGRTVAGAYSTSRVGAAASTAVRLGGRVGRRRGRCRRRRVG